MEDNQRICDLLALTLKETREFNNIKGLRYDEQYEIVTAEFASGGKRLINVSMDSGIAMIKDILKAIC